MASVVSAQQTPESEIPPPTAVGTAVSSLVGDATLQDENGPTSGEELLLGGLRFWMIFVSLMVSVFLSALEFTSVSTALPVIVEDLHGDQFVWVGSAFAIGEAAVLPLIGGMTDIFGRRPMVLLSLALFTLGSGVSAGAKNMGMMIGGRAVQGIGGGGILALTEIVVADLVPLAQRGNYNGLIGAVWAIACAIGPPIGGAFAQTNWRWLFWMNLPIAGIAFLMVFFFMNLKVPQDSFSNKMKRMDWVGNFLAIGSTTSSILALTWAGVEHPWSSYQVLTPLILGFAGLAAFLTWEAKSAKEPVVPWEILNNRTSFTGYLQDFWHGIVACVVVFYLPTYFQGALMQGPIHSGTSVFGISFTIAPFAIISGFTVVAFNRYKPQHIVSWGLMIIGVGLFTLLEYDTPRGNWIGYQMIAGAGIGALYVVPTFPILAPIALNQTAHALAFFVFVRTYALTWGLTIGATILQNELKKRLPAQLLAQYPSGAEISYQIIPQIKFLEEPLQTEVRIAFAKSIRIIWFVMLALSVVGFLTSLLMGEVPMHTTTDEAWRMEDKKKAEDAEKDGMKA